MKCIGDAFGEDAYTFNWGGAAGLVRPLGPQAERLVCLKLITTCARIPEGGDKMSNQTLIIVIVLVVLLFGGFGFRRWRR